MRVKECNLEGLKMVTKERAHAHIAHRLELPDSYEKNLDSLWDELMAIDEDTMIHLDDPDALIDNLGQYGEDIITTFEDAAEGNGKLVFDADE